MPRAAQGGVLPVGRRTWRVRYRREDDIIGSVNGFPTKAAATDHANTLESD